MPPERVLRFEDRACLTSQVASRLLAEMCARQAATGTVSLCWSGGDLTNEVLDQIGSLAPASDLDAGGIHLWWAWDLFEAADNADRNSLQTLSRLRGAMALDAAKTHPIPSSSVATDAQAAAAQYELELGEAASIDICVLQVGPGGQIAGLYPHQASDPNQVPAASTLAVGLTDAPGSHPNLVTLTPTGISSCGQIWLLASGETLADTLVRANQDDPNLPTSWLEGVVLWLVDTDAASGLDFHHCSL